MGRGRSRRLADLAGTTGAGAALLLAAGLGMAGAGGGPGRELSRATAAIQPEGQAGAQTGGQASDQAGGQPEEMSTGRVTLYLRDGRQLEGPLVRQTPSEVVITVAGFDTTFNMADVMRVTPVPPLRERYESWRARVADDDIEQLLMLVDWLRDQEAYSLALVELAHILQVDPGNRQAESLKQQIQGMILLKAESAGRPSGAGENREVVVQRRERREFPVLTPDQINLIKVYEVNLSDPPRLSVSRETIRELMDAYAGHELIPQTKEGRAALERRPPVYILELMFRLRAREFYGDIRVEGEPASMRMFRENVHRPWLVTTCASSGCHGGQQAGNLWLKNTSPNNEQTIYTNFLILDRYRMRDGTPLINYEEPAKSPLLQMALPRESSLYPHPLVATSSTSVWRPVIGSPDDRRFQKAVEWINSMYRPRPEYPVTFDPPTPEVGVPALPDEPIGER